MHPRLLIVGTVPYHPQSTSRAFDAYFHDWEKENLAQIFSNAKTPCKGHCGALYQITDHRMLMRWLRRVKETGVIYRYEDLPDRWADGELEIDHPAIRKAYRLGSRRTAGTHVLRGLLWRKKYWCTERLNQWLDAFDPECVFLAFSDDYFIPQIAYYVATRYDIPIVSCIGDDYYFNRQSSFHPLYPFYKTTYRKLIRKVLAHRGSAIYISDKIRDRYNEAFGLDGETVYLASTVQRKPFTPIHREAPLITYFGNIRMGRNRSLCDIADALGRINDQYRIEVYSSEEDPAFYGVIQKNRHAVWGGRIPYERVQEKMQASDITVVAEGFAREDLEQSRYSLSTKAADALASGAAILTYGPAACGIVEYMKSTQASMVCTKREDLRRAIQTLLEDVELQKQYYARQIVMTETHHNLQSSCKTAERVIRRAMRKPRT